VGDEFINLDRAALQEAERLVGVTQGGEGGEDGESLAENGEGFDRHFLTGGRDTEEQDLSTWAGEVHCAGHDTRHTGGIDDGVVAIALEIVEGGEGSVRAEGAGEGEAFGVLFDDDDLGGGVEAESLQEEQPDGAGTDQGDAGCGLRVEALQSVKDAGQGFHESAVFEGQVTDVEGGFFGDADVLGHAAGEGHTDCLPVETEVLAIVEAVNAVVTGQVGFDSDAITGFEAGYGAAGPLDDAGEFVPGGDGVGAEVFALVDVDVGAADAAG